MIGISIRSKLVAAISLLIVILFSFTANLLINEKKNEMAQDIYLNTLAFSKLTAGTVADNYDLYLAEGGFVYFNREMKTLFEQNNDVSGITIAGYSGNVLYSSVLDKGKRYEGLRKIKDLDLLTQVQSENVSFRAQSGTIYYLKNGLFVDKNEKTVKPFEQGTLIDHFVVPANEKYSVIYSVSYHNLEKRVSDMIRRIVYLAVFGIMLGIIFSFFMSGRVTKPVFKLVDGARRIATGDFNTRVEITSNDELGYLGESFNKMAVDLELSVEAKLYKERVTRELELATQIQQQLIPKQVPNIDGIDIAASVDPAGEIGGDMYDFIPINDERLLMYLGDVTGHGVPAGIVSSIASALFLGFSSRIDLKDIMSKVNKVLKVKTMTNMFMTLCLMEWNLRDKKFSYVSAGHEQLVHFRKADAKASLEKSGGLALGMIADISKMLTVYAVDFEMGDYIISYSDGIPEAWKNEKDIYGMERLLAVVEKFGKMNYTAEQMRKAIIDDVTTFRDGYEQMDDITIMVIKRR